MEEKDDLIDTENNGDLDDENNEKIEWKRRRLLSP